MITGLSAGVSERNFRDEGATATEYAIMVSLVALAILLSVAAFGQAVLALFQGSSTALGAIIGS